MTTSHAPVKYNLEFVEDLISSGFEYTLPQTVVDTLLHIHSSLNCIEPLKSTTYHKFLTPHKPVNNISSYQSTNKKRKNKEIVDDSEWSTISVFKPTKITTNKDTNSFDSIRININKINDKNYDDIFDKITNIIDDLIIKQTEDDTIDLSVISSNIFDIASTNKYLSKLYAQLYSNLSTKYDFIKVPLKQNFDSFMELLKNIETVDPNENYDKFCELNKISEKRKSLASFYSNLVQYNCITKEAMQLLTREILYTIYTLISIENKKCEVEEMTEIFALLYNPKEYKDEDDDDLLYQPIDGYTMSEIVEKLASSKTKDYNSFTNKALFKFMDINEM